MGNQQSDGFSSGGSGQSPFDSLAPEDRQGWKVLSVSANSPAANKGIVPYFTVITHVDGTRVANNDDEAALIPLIREGHPTQITVLNLATLRTRVVSITPSRGWGGEGLLGLMIRWDRFENAHMEAIHVLDVHLGSPAQAAGLRAHSDFLLGTSRLAFRSYHQLDQFLHQHQGQPARISVFNRDTYSVRDVTIVPHSGWGGAGSLGCDVGFGFLHALNIDGQHDVTYEAESGPGVAQQHVQHQQQQPLQQQQHQEGAVHGHQVAAPMAPFQQPAHYGQQVEGQQQHPQQHQQQQFAQPTFAQMPAHGQAQQPPQQAQQPQHQQPPQSAADLHAQQQRQWEAHQQALAQQAHAQAQHPTSLLPPHYVAPQAQQIQPPQTQQPLSPQQHQQQPQQQHAPVHPPSQPSSPERAAQQQVSAPSSAAYSSGPHVPLSSQQVSPPQQQAHPYAAAHQQQPVSLPHPSSAAFAHPPPSQSQHHQPVQAFNPTTAAYTTTYQLPSQTPPPALQAQQAQQQHFSPPPQHAQQWQQPPPAAGNLP